MSFFRAADGLSSAFTKLSYGRFFLQRMAGNQSGIVFLLFQIAVLISILLVSLLAAVICINCNVPREHSQMAIQARRQIRLPA